MRTRILVLVVCAVLLNAQSDRGTLTGTVTDAGGGFVPGAQVTATQIATNTQSKTTTNSAGEFTIPQLAVGSYKVTVANQGFKTAVHDSVRLEAGGTARVDTKLEVGAIQQSVEVSAQSTQLATDNVKIVNSISNRMIESLPTVVSGNMRSPYDLANLTAQVSQTGDNDFRIGGGQQGASGAMLDGVSSNTNRAGATSWASVNTPSLDAITEFVVETNGFKAEFGRASGGVITFVSKSGTNSYHGTAFDYIRNNAFDARRFFSSTVSVYRQHDFGATFGGPVRIPKLYDGKDKTFFFFSYEAFRNRVGASTSPTAVPPIEFYSGDLRNAVSQTLQADGTNTRYIIHDPNTTRFDPNLGTGGQYVRTPFSDNQIPVPRFDAISTKILELAKGSLTQNYRTDVTPGTWNYWQRNMYQTGSSINPNTKYSVRVDQVINASHRLSAYIAYNKRETVPGPTGANGIPGILNTFMHLVNTSPVYRGTWDYTISPRLFNHFFFGINRFVDANYPLTEGMGWKAKGICVPNTPDCDRSLVQVDVGDFGTWGGVGYSGSLNPVYSFNNDLNWMHGKHLLKVGYMYEYTPYVGLGQQDGSGRFSFTTGYTQLPSQSSRDVGGGSGFASFLLGLPNHYQIMTPRRLEMEWRYNAMFIQDDWRVTPNLTLNLGVRYEFNWPAHNGGDKCADFDPTVPNPGANGRLGALVFCGVGPGRIGRSVITKGWYLGVGPRIGFSWNPVKRLIVRAGGGASYAPVKSIGGSNHQQGFFQTFGVDDQTGSTTTLMKVDQGVPPFSQPPFIDPTFSNNLAVDWWQGQEANRLPTMWQWNFSIQREIAWKPLAGTLIEGAYSAMIGTHLVANLLDYNKINISKLPANLNVFTNAGRVLLSSPFNTGRPGAAGYTIPYPQFPTNYTLAQSLRPYPQYSAVNTGSGGGDKSGHSSYHALVVKVTRRYAQNLIIDSSYVLSKMLTDSDSAWGSGAAMDHYNRRLDKGLSGTDRTHEVKLNYVYELPVGPGKRWLHNGFLAHSIGGWRLGMTHRYASGTPIGFGGAYGFPSNTIGNRPTITQYDDWRAPIAGEKFDPNVDRYFKPATVASWVGDVATITTQGWFPLQPRDRIGNMTKNNPKMRNFPIYSENVSLAKTFNPFKDKAFEADLRFEAFNMLNRCQFSTPSTNMSSSSFGQVTGQSNSARTMQFALKLMW